MLKTLTTLEAIATVKWYQDIQENENKPLTELPIKIQWIIKKNIKKLEPISQNFFSFREESEDIIRQEYATDEKSEETINEETGETIRQVKSEFITEYQNRVNELNQKLTEIVLENNDIDLDTIDLETIIEENGDKFINLTVEDLDALSFMAKESK